MGIRFDSTLMVDFYWVGGGLNANSATHGVLFQPRNLHPLDGQIFGASGVVESRYHFRTNISGGTHDVTMDTTVNTNIVPTINDADFYFQNATRNQVNYVGSGFVADTVTFTEAPRVRDDQAIPFDLFSPAFRVTVIPPVGDPSVPGTPPQDTLATVYAPDGSVFTINSSNSSGLQEAFDYAASLNADLLVFGRGVRNADVFSNFGIYGIGETLDVPTLNNRTWLMYSITMNHGPAPPSTYNTALAFGDMTGTHFEMTGQLAAQAAGHIKFGVHIKPTTQTMIGNEIRVMQIQMAQDPLVTGVLIDPSDETILMNQFYFHEINDTNFGLTVANPSSTTTFESNFLRTLHIHDFTSVGFQLGQTSSNAQNIKSNTIQMGLNSDGTSFNPLGLQVWGDANGIEKFTAYSSVAGGIFNGAEFMPSSTGNTMFYGNINHSNNCVVDYGTGNQFFQLPYGGTCSFQPPTSSLSLALPSFDDAMQTALSQPAEFVATAAPFSLALRNSQSGKHSEDLLAALPEAARDELFRSGSTVNGLAGEGSDTNRVHEDVAMEWAKFDSDLEATLQLSD